MNKLATGAKTVSLVLGSGGARGLAHIGIIRWLAEHGYQIRSVSGCSMGALVGGIYAAGKLAEYEQWVSKIDKLGFFRCSTSPLAGAAGRVDLAPAAGTWR